MCHAAVHPSSRPGAPTHHNISTPFHIAIQRVINHLSFTNICHNNKFRQLSYLHTHYLSLLLTLLLIISLIYFLSSLLTHLRTYSIASIYFTFLISLCSPHSYHQVVEGEAVSLPLIPSCMSYLYPFLQSSP